MTHSDICYLVAVIIAAVLVVWHVTERAAVSALTVAVIGAIALGLLLAP